MNRFHKVMFSARAQIYDEYFSTQIEDGVIY